MSTAVTALHHSCVILFFFFFNDTATTEIYTLSLHDALPISRSCWRRWARRAARHWRSAGDRKSTRLNSSHTIISYAVFCLKKKKTKRKLTKDIEDDRVTRAEEKKRVLQ